MFPSGQDASITRIRRRRGQTSRSLDGSHGGTITIIGSSIAANFDVDDYLVWSVVVAGGRVLVQEQSGWTGSYLTAFEGIGYADPHCV